MRRMPHTRTTHSWPLQNSHAFVPPSLSRVAYEPGRLGHPSDIPLNHRMPRTYPCGLICRKSEYRRMFKSVIRGGSERPIGTSVFRLIVFTWLVDSRQVNRRANLIGRKDEVEIRARHLSHRIRPLRGEKLMEFKRNRELFHRDQQRYTGGSKCY